MWQSPRVCRLPPRSDCSMRHCILRPFWVSLRKEAKIHPVLQWLPHCLLVFFVFWIRSFYPRAAQMFPCCWRRWPGHKTLSMLERSPMPQPCTAPRVLLERSLLRRTAQPFVLRMRRTSRSIGEGGIGVGI
jgi:hypothetical protein